MKRLLFGVAAAALLAGAAQAAKTDLTLGVGLEPPNLDPTAGAAAAIDEVVYANVFEGLTRIDETGAAQPALARSWEISEDGLTYVFHLVEGATFHDGAAFDASDVKFSFDRAMAEDSQNAQKVLFEPIETIEVVDPATVKITLKRPTGAFLFNMGWGDAVIVDPESAATNATHPVGTGPFVFGDWAKGASITLEKNPDYWGEPAQLDRATFKFISDPTAALAALMAGDVDGFPIWPSPETVPQIEADPRFDVVMGSTEGETILGTNNAKAPFDQLKVRQAIAEGLQVMLCVGEQLAEREAGHSEEVVARQVAAGLEGVLKEDLSRISLAYEPVWAIGTGRTASPEDAQAMHQRIRADLENQYDAPSASGMRIVYGGSVKPSNASDIFAQPDVDGGLIGGASLDAEAFLEIVQAAASSSAS